MAAPENEKFSPGTEFAIYAGLPLTLSGEKCTAWDRVGGRPFDRELFDAHSKPCSEAQFREAARRFDDLEYNLHSAAGVPIILPRHFPTGTRFRDSEGVPLAALNGQCVVWDRPGGRWFSNVEFEDRAYQVSEEEFRRMVVDLNNEDQEQK
jgi:hypothetical protein